MCTLCAFCSLLSLNLKLLLKKKNHLIQKEEKKHHLSLWAFDCLLPAPSAWSELLSAPLVEPLWSEHRQSSGTPGWPRLTVLLSLSEKLRASCLWWEWKRRLWAGSAREVPGQWDRVWWNKRWQTEPKERPASSPEVCFWRWPSTEDGPETLLGPILGIGSDDKRPHEWRSLSHCVTLGVESPTFRNISTEQGCIGSTDNPWSYRTLPVPTHFSRLIKFGIQVC